MIPQRQGRVEVFSTVALAERAQAISLRSVDADVVSQVKTSIADTIFCAIGALAEPYGERVVRHAEQQRASGTSAILGTMVRTSAGTAAFAKGALAHGLDYDDMLKPMIGHPSATILPAVLAVAEDRGLSGATVVEACIAGMEVAACLGHRLNVGHYDMGWHPTAVLGTVAAAAGVAKALGFDVSHTSRAMGIAASFSGGIRASFGSAVKGLHAGNAARAAVDAAALTSLGVPAHLDVLERRFGFYDMFGNGEHPDSDDPEVQLLTGPAANLARSGLRYKRYACCGRIQPAVEGLLWLCREEGIALSDVAELWCGTYEMATRTLSFSRPRTAFEARYSMHYCLAKALQAGSLTLEHFSDAHVQDPSVEGIIGLIRLEVDPTLTNTEQFPSRIHLRLDDGSERRILAHRSANGTRVEVDGRVVDIPLTSSDLEQKWKECLSATIQDGSRFADIQAQLHQLELLTDASALTATICAGPHRS